MNDKPPPLPLNFEPWRNVNDSALKFAVAAIRMADHPMTVTIKKVAGSTPGMWVYNVDVKNDK